MIAREARRLRRVLARRYPVFVPMLSVGGRHLGPMPRIERPLFVLRLDLLPLRVSRRFAFRKTRVMALSALAFRRFELFAVPMLSGLGFRDASTIGHRLLSRVIAIPARQIRDAPPFKFCRPLQMRRLPHLAQRLLPFRMMFARPGRIPMRPPAHRMPTMLGVVVAEPFGMMFMAPAGMTLPPPAGRMPDVIIVVCAPPSGIILTSHTG